MAKKKAEIILLKEDLKDTLKKCSCCEDVLFASVKSDDTEFGAFKNQSGWYYQAWCKSCFKEKVKIYSRSNKPKTEYVLEQIRLKREQERAERQWTLYQFTVDITKFDDRVKKTYKKIHKKYHYIGVTKQEVENRWNEHLYNLKRGEHHNYFLNSIYTNIRELYNEMSEDEFFNFFKNDIITFKAISKLDKDLTEEQAKIYECFEVRRLEHNLRAKHSKKLIELMRTQDYTQKDLCAELDEMIINIEHCKSNMRLKKEIDKKNNSSVGSTQVTK